ncbi:hypothetical protein, conserved [Trypanosoma brucei gambiense DAL972]|uniref:Methyltransferase type 11 domain-containing protein n=2 Tax=Trypanozoon TaxID=39700 RepID=C9ZX82_TRYB9|nr:hypothetical protein, conserved [Trypanosoma brucei gambiense DAL972]CBH14026.1 hypothetical protein, conserved [Trypanosoma brucei gambiense DAL972]|eukprot:XP_011776297.1 hypothetical protein, conserved [Trypanosoma brucei gambiense DAL972]
MLALCKCTAPETKCLMGSVIFTAVVSSAATYAFRDVFDHFLRCRYKFLSWTDGVWVLRKLFGFFRKWFPHWALCRPSKPANVYESDASVRQYMEFHYTLSSESFAQNLRMISESFDYPIRVARKFHEFVPANDGKERRALDLGCAVGASSLEMSKYFSRVVGIDYSVAFIKMARNVVQSALNPNIQPIKYEAPLQGDITVERTACLPDGAVPQRCRFYRGDAMNLLDSDGDDGRGHIVPPVHHGDTNDEDITSWYRVPSGERFDAVLVANLLCRVPNPRKLLDMLPLLLVSGGILVISSPYSWEGSAEERDTWVGGRAEGSTSEILVKEILGANFDLLSETDEAFLIRDHVRRYQLGVAHCTVWRRR